MTYATTQDLFSTFGEGTIRRSASRPDDTDGNAAIQNAIDYAKNYIDSKLSARFPLPLPTVPQLLVDLACDLAYERLCFTADILTETVEKRANRARSDLDAIASGKMNLGLPTNAADTNPSPQPIFTSGKKIFGSDARDL